MFPPVVIQRDKNQITIPSSIAKQIKARKGTKYRISIDKHGDILLKVVKNDIRKYSRLIKTDKSAVEMIREERIKDEQKALNW
jgi:antitoxin component of MazEF toxin-antitoxin module